MWIVKKSKVHGRGVFAAKDILKNVRIIEYIGENNKVRRRQRSERMLLKIFKF